MIPAPSHPGRHDHDQPRRDHRAETRPLGASFADWMAVPRRDVGLGWGTGPVTLVLAVVILGLVGLVTWTRRDLVESLDVEDGDITPGGRPGPRTSA